MFGTKVLRIFKELFQKFLEARFGTAVPTCYDKIKKRGNAAFFCTRYQLGLSAPNPDQRAFREKPFGNQKAFDRINGGNSVGSSLAYLSPKER